MSIAGITLQCLSVVLLLLFALPINAQRLPIRHYDVVDGLAHSRVGAIYQDRKGYLWFGTREGLSRFDGYRFTNYGINDGLGQIIVNAIAEDRQGRLWVGTNGGGISRLLDDPQENSSLRLSKSPSGSRQKFISFRVGDTTHSNQVNALVFDADDNIWCATDVGLYVAATKQHQQIKFKEIAFHTGNALTMPAFSDRYNRLWFGIADKLIEVNRDQVIKYDSGDCKSNCILTGIVEYNGRVLVSNQREVFEFLEPIDNKKPGTLQPFPLTLLPHQLITTMKVDARGTLWIGTESGLIKYEDRKQTLYTTEHGLSNNCIRSMAEDLDGNLWIGTEVGGVCKLSGESIVSIIMANGEPRQNISRVIEDRRGRIYAASTSNGLLEIVAGKAVSIPASLQAPFNTAIPYQDNYGDWWFNTSKGLYRFNGPKLQFLRGRKVDRSEGIVAAGIKASNYNLDNQWLFFPLEKELYHLPISRRGVFERFSLNTNLSDIRKTLLVDREGAVWLGGHEQLARWKNGKTIVFQVTKGLPETRPRSFFQDSRGWLWVGLRYGGVSFTKDPAAISPEFINYSIETGLANNTVWSISEDDTGHIYLGTSNGLEQLNPLTGKTRHFNSRDGLAGDLINDCFKDRNGNIWIATTLGISMFNPRVNRIANNPPQMYFSRVQIAGEDLSLAETGTQYAKNIDLPATRNNIFIEYVAPSFYGEQRLRYQYKLEGVDTDWNLPTEGRSVNYARLASGSYRFLVRAINHEGVMSTEAAVFEFNILRPLWQRWWFLMLASMMIGLVGYTIYRYRISHLLKVERIRTRIATDLHDDIGANLTRISILSEVAQQQNVNSNRQSNGWLQLIADIARESVGSMSDIVWAINPDHDHLTDLIHKMRRHSEEVFTLRGIDLKLSTPDAVPNLKLNVNARRDLYLIFKETVNNAARHSDCTRVEIELLLAGGNLVLTINDNGRGFNPAAKNDGNGLQNIQRRSAALGAELSIESNINNGTRLWLKISSARSRLGA